MLSRSTVHVGMKVIFGRRRGEKTLGEIVSAGPTKAQVKTLEKRGLQKTHQAGAIWGVPYHLLSVAPADAESANPVMHMTSREYDKGYDAGYEKGFAAGVLAGKAEFADSM